MNYLNAQRAEAMLAELFFKHKEMASQQATLTKYHFYSNYLAATSISLQSNIPTRKMKKMKPMRNAIRIFNDSWQAQGGCFFSRGPWCTCQQVQVFFRFCGPLRQGRFVCSDKICTLVLNVFALGFALSLQYTTNSRGP